MSATTIPLPASPKPDLVGALLEHIKNLKVNDAKAYEEMNGQFKAAKSARLVPASPKPTPDLYTQIFRASEEYLEGANRCGDWDEIHTFGEMARAFLNAPSLDEKESAMEDVESDIKSILKQLKAPIGTLETLKRNQEAWDDLITDLLNLWIEWDDGERDEDESDDE